MKNDNGKGYKIRSFNDNKTQSIQRKSQIQNENFQIKDSYDDVFSGQSLNKISQPSMSEQSIESNENLMDQINRLKMKGQKRIRDFYSKQNPTKNTFDDDAFLTNVRSKELDQQEAQIKEENFEEEFYQTQNLDDINRNLANFLTKNSTDDLAEIRRMLKQVNQGITFAEREFTETQKYYNSLSKDLDLDL